jgi:hypothetical protein
MTSLVQSRKRNFHAKTRKLSTQTRNNRLDFGSSTLNIELSSASLGGLTETMVNVVLAFGGR